jgi:hypothetical protein
MKKFVIVLALASLFWVNSATAQDKGAVFVFINPYKLFLGLVNIGAEYQINADHSVYMNADFAFFRSEHLKRINHPDIVITPGYRFYVPLDGKNGSRPFTGISASMTYAASNEDRPSALQWGIGSELGYRWFPDETTTIAPRGIVNYNLTAKKFIFGAEVLAGKSFD